MPLKNPTSAPLLRLLLLSLALAAIPARAQTSSDTAMGVFPFLVGNMDARIGTIVNDCASRGIDTIYVSVFRTTGPSTGSLWVTDETGAWNPAWGSVRPTGAGIHLGNLIQAAHAANLRVVAVVKCFDGSVQPTDAAHRAYLLSILTWLTQSYRGSGEPVWDLDGVALDYVRFVSAGAGNSAQLVTDFVRDVRGVIGPMSLHAYLIANRFTFDGPVYNGTFNSYSSAMGQLTSAYGQDWEQLAQHVDVMMPMCYTADGAIYSTAALHEAYVRTAAQYCRTACTRAGQPQRRVTPAIRTWTDSSETCTPTTVEASILGALSGGGDGYQAFRYGTCQPSWWQKLQQYAVPGGNFPRPILSPAVQGLGATLDATASVDVDQPSNVLLQRYDLDGDGAFDTPWALNAFPWRQLMRRPGTWRVGLALRDVDGHVSVTRRQIVVGDVLASGPSYGAAAGSPYPLQLDLGPIAAGEPYLVIGSLSGLGTSPWRPGFELPIVWDSVSEGLLGAANTPIFQNAQGTLDPLGRATAQFQLPPGALTFLVGQQVSWAAVGFDASGLPRYVTNPTTMSIVP